MLLHALWLLLTASALVTGLLVLASRASTGFALADQETRRELAQESAVELVIYDILTQGARSRWLRPPRVTDEVVIEDQRIALSVQNVSGLVDAGTGNDKVLAVLLGEILEAEGRKVLARIGAVRGTLGARARPFSTYAELRAIMHVSDHVFGCFYRHATLFSGRSEPDPLLASPSLASLLQLDRRESPPRSAMEAHGTTAAGSTYRIEAVSVPTRDAGSQILSIEVTITGRLRPGHLIRSWQYLPRVANTESCS